MDEDARHAHTEAHERFRTTLAHRRQLIADQWGELRSGRWSAAGVDMLRHWVHQLANSSIQYGYSALGEYARELEHRLRSVVGDSRPSQDSVAGIVGSVSRLKLQLDRVLAMDPAEIDPHASKKQTQPIAPALLLFTPDGMENGSPVSPEAQIWLDVCIEQAAGDGDAWSALPDGAALLLEKATLAQHEARKAGLEKALAARPQFRWQSTLQPLRPGSGSHAAAAQRLESTALAAQLAVSPSPAAPAVRPASVFASKALPFERLALLVQPVCDENGKPQRLHDVLVRQREADGRLSPVPELSHSETKAIGAQLDLWVMRTAVQHMAAMPPHSRGIELAVRLSEASLDNPMLVPVVKAQLAGIPKGSPDRLVLQIDERWLAVHEQAGIEAVATLRDLGCELMLGYFGETGHPRSAAWAAWFDYAKLAPSRVDDLARASARRETLEKQIRSAAERGGRVVAWPGKGRKAKQLLVDWGVRLFL
ncbi:MAG TPA: EAL domain-containing protein [Arenimonas sp.]|nr:EAL domain-containing protein [Arenimonas sp.]